MSHVRYIKNSFSRKSVADYSVSVKFCAEKQFFSWDRYRVSQNVSCFKTIIEDDVHEKRRRCMSLKLTTASTRQC